MQDVHRGRYYEYQRLNGRGNSEPAVSLVIAAGMLHRFAFSGKMQGAL